MPCSLLPSLQEKDARIMTVSIATSELLILPLARFASASVRPEGRPLFKAKNTSLCTPLLCCGGRIAHNDNFKDICCLLSYRIQQTMLHM